MKFFITRVFVLLAFALTSCVNIGCNIPSEGDLAAGGTLRHVLPRDSFVKIEKSIKIKMCNPQNPEECVFRKLQSSASGFVVKNGDEGSYVMTAAHVCDNAEIDAYVSGFGATIEERGLYTVDIDGNKYKYFVLQYNIQKDMCMVYARGLNRSPVQIARSGPVPGDVALNLAAPVGVFDKNMIPILTGYYNGVGWDGLAFYSIPAIGGSSGSPVFNNRGEVIGMIHSVHSRFQFIALSPLYSEVVDFISEYARKEELVNKLIDKMLSSP